ncbi:actin cytoskeleton-regulatory complex protein pan1-like [Xyrichtys novacula]|uniref:Actin cytoskeleton-regulatory complex protein pan1-like n=1 Tax=Xyrichtys novacula TaxID=13765 RepID=A0AAV1FTR9_XYRNO|nr:actin cytoskeleton-regulatory complex protein pan1-like [Xyrichtys novacula]
MAGVKSHATVEAAPLKSCIVVKEGSSYSEKVSQYLESSCGQNGQGGVSVETVEEDSDSGDSLFITQKPVPIPVRSTRGRPNLRSDTRPPRDLDEDEDDSSSSSSPERRFEIPATQKEKRMKTKLPEYSFPFLTGKRYRRSGRGTREQNRGLHNAGIAGFFREMWEAHKRGEDVELSLPTVDTDGEDISPLSEEEEERSEDEDIKVVERKVFAVPLKIKNQQTWCDHLKQKSIRKAADARQERSQGEQRKAFNEKQAEANTSRNIEEEDEEEVVPRNIESSSEQPETLGTDRVQEGGQEEEDTSHLQQKMIRRTTQEVIENSESDLGSEDSASSNAEKVVKEKKKRKSIEEDEEQPQSSEKAKNKTKGKREDEIVRSEERREEGEESTATSQEMRISHFIQRNKPLSFSDDATYEEESEGASSFVALDEHMERSPKQRKTRMRTDSEEVDNSLDLFGNENVENTDDTQRKAEDDQMATKKKTKEGLESESFSDKKAELDAARGDDSASVQQRKRSSSFLGADAESLQSVETPVDGAGRPGDTAGHLDTESAEMYRNEEECVEEVRKGENRERLEIQDRGDKDQEQEFGEPNTTCHTAPSERTAPEQEGMGKGSESNTESLRTVESVESTVDARLPSTDESLVLKEKKKKRKKKNTLEFQDRVDTDQEQEFGEPNTTCLRISKRSGRDTDSLRTVEIVANAGLSSTDEAVVLKKKKKKKREMLEIQDGVDKEQGFGEPITTCMSASPGRTAPELKGIGERLGSDTESLRAIESIESSIDVGLHSTDGSVVLNKKKKKRKKREMLDIQDGVEEEREFGELNTTCLSASPVRTEPEVKGKSKGSGSYTGSLRTVESVKSALDAGLSSTDEAVVLKKKKKKKKREMLEIQDSVNKEQAQEFEEPNATCLKSSPERTAPEQKGKSMRSGSDPGSPTTVKSVVSVVDAGLPSTDDSVVLNEKKKKRKKRKMLDIQDRVDKDQEQEFRKPKTTCLIASPERTEAELRRISKRLGSYTESVRTESVESVVDAGIPSTDEAVVLKKKKKKREISEIQDGVDKNQEQEFGEQNTTCYTALHERSEPEQKGISKRSRSDTGSLRTEESVKSAEDAGPPSTDEPVVLKKKKKEKEGDVRNSGWCGQRSGAGVWRAKHNLSECFT